jgi:predicted aspartyl protease
MALESGRVNSHREAVVLLRFRNGAVIECVVDTGFDGALMLPRVFVPKIQIAII